MMDAGSVRSWRVLTVIMLCILSGSHLSAGSGIGSVGVGPAVIKGGFMSLSSMCSAGPTTMKGRCVRLGSQVVSGSSSEWVVLGRQFVHCCPVCRLSPRFPNE